MQSTEVSELEGNPLQDPILIVGAGIAGQTLACALDAAGINCELLEKKENWDILGSGMYVQNNALRGFEEIGVADRIVAEGWRSPTGASILADVHGDEVTRTVVPPCPGSDLPGYVPIARPRLHNILLEAVERAGVSIRMGTTVTDIANESDAVTVTFSDGSTGRYGLVVGADGINSSVRSMIFDSVEPQYSGFSNWRAILPMDEPLSEITWQMGPETSFGIIPISDDQLYVAGVSKEPGNPYFDHAELLDLMRDRFGMFGGLAGKMLDRLEGPEQVVYTPINEISMPLPWAKGRAVLVGDAAHASTPFWAQGASMAVEDVILLARLLREQDGPIQDVLDAWQGRRYARCQFVQEGSKQSGVRAHAPGRVMDEAFANMLRQNAQADVTRRYERLNQPI